MRRTVTAFVSLLAASFLGTALFASGCGAGEEYPESEILFDGTYRLEGADNMEFTFGDDSTLTVWQEGLYRFGEREGEPVVSICLDDTSRELPEDYAFTDYRLKQEGRRTILTYVSDEFSLDASPMVLVPLKGEDGLLSGSAFDGTYQIGEDGDSYQYIFKEDGGVIMQVRGHYFADGTRMTLSDHAGSTDYLYEETGQGMTLMNQESEPVFVLIRQEE